MKQQGKQSTILILYNMYIYTRGNHWPQWPPSRDSQCKKTVLVLFESLLITQSQKFKQDSSSLSLNGGSLLPRNWTDLRWTSPEPPVIDAPPYPHISLWFTMPRSWYQIYGFFKDKKKLWIKTLFTSRKNNELSWHILWLNARAAMFSVCTGCTN